jgi:hypothetical protein
VNTFSHFYVAAHQSEMRAQAANERLARTLPARSIGLGATLKSVWSFLGGPAEPPTLPTLTNCPYRG